MSNGLNFNRSQLPHWETKENSSYLTRSEWNLNDILYIEGLEQTMCLTKVNSFFSLHGESFIPQSISLHLTLFWSITAMWRDSSLLEVGPTGLHLPTDNYLLALKGALCCVKRRKGCCFRPGWIYCLLLLVIWRVNLLSCCSHWESLLLWDAGSHKNKERCFFFKA